MNGDSTSGDVNRRHILQGVALAAASEATIVPDSGRGFSTYSRLVA